MKNSLELVSISSLSNTCSLFLLYFVNLFIKPGPHYGNISTSTTHKLKQKKPKKGNEVCDISIDIRHKHKTTSISYGRTKANSKDNSFCFVLTNLRGKVTEPKIKQVVATLFAEQYCSTAVVMTLQPLFNSQYCSFPFEQYCSTLISQQRCSLLMEHGETCIN